MTVSLLRTCRDLTISDLSDAQWEAISDLIVRKKQCGPKSRADLRSMVNALIYRLRTSCQWRMLPLEYERWKIVEGYFRRWQAHGLWEKLNDRLRE